MQLNTLGALLVATGFVAFLLYRLHLPRRFRERRAFRRRVLVEDALKHMYAAEERGRQATVESLAGALRLSPSVAADVSRTLHQRGLVRSADGMVLTRAGERAARQIVRAHRLWERYLADELDAPATMLHRQADRREHHLAQEDIERLSAQLGHPTTDPHGDPIPAVSEQHPLAPDWPVTLMPQGVTSEIVHVEDEPEAVFARLAAHGFEPGQRIIVRESNRDSLVIERDGVQHTLSPVDAANIFVVPAPEATAVRPHSLADLRPGEHAVVRSVGVSGFARRRLFDLGFTPGARVECAFPAAFGEPRAYRVRGSCIALRREQAARIQVEPPATAEDD